MKTQQIIPSISLFLLPFLLTGTVLAHCPSMFKAETACFMLEKNLLYIYDQKLEHNGPYKDIEGEISFRDNQGKTIPHEKVARGILKILSPKNLLKVALEIKKDGKRHKILIKAE